ncbi:hypothetical protein OAG53_00975 [Akkermansiaceae bacterium]|nr:hypothetical protein [Akkermansiaceae bacterium]
MQGGTFFTAILTSLLFIFAACSPAPPVYQQQLPQASHIAVKLTAAQKASIGRKIWQNESGGKVTGLTHWNDGEEFPSMGIGHFIWYPKGFDGRWTETWPEFVKFATARGKRLPAIAYSPDCPWQKKPAFMRDFNGSELTGLRKWLAANITVQTEFIAYKSRAALPNILAAAPAADRARIQRNYDKIATTPNGVYALVDYVNFKGDGTNPREAYAGQGWGLKWVLMEMRDVAPGQDAAQEFGQAAKRRLHLRIKNSPRARGESRWRAGWDNRCDSYGRPL